LDADGKVIRPAILWNDQRTASQCRQVVESAGGKTKLIEYTNNDMLPGYTGGKILWLREHEPENYERSRIFLNPKDYIRFKLTGEYATEVSDASGTGLFNVRERRFSKELLTILDIPSGLFAECYESTEITGYISEQASRYTGIPKGTPVAGGGGDAVIQTTGSGLIQEGILGTIIGTSGIVAMGLNSFKENKEGKLQIFCNNAPGRWHSMGVTLCAGGAYRWFRDMMFQPSVKKVRGSLYSILDNMAASSPPGSRNLIFMPYLTGERCPYSDPNARGAFIGLNLQHGCGDMARSVMEGVIYSLRQVWDLMAGLDVNMKVDEIRVSGGGAVSPLWRQIHADVFQIPVRTVSGSSEGGAFGAALVAGAACGFWGSIEEAVGVIGIETETLPRREYSGIYDEIYGVYNGLYHSLKTANESLCR
jgi:xylulokinase